MLIHQDKGGGTSAVMAFEQSVPVVTLPEGDVATFVGEEFSCASLGEMENVIERYITDRRFYETKKKRCKEISDEKSMKLETIMDNMQKFVDDLRANIIEDEKSFNWIKTKDNRT